MQGRKNNRILLAFAPATKKVSLPVFDISISLEVIVEFRYDSAFAPSYPSLRAPGVKSRWTERLDQTLNRSNSKMASNRKEARTTSNKGVITWGGGGVWEGFVFSLFLCPANGLSGFIGVLMLVKESYEKPKKPLMLVTPGSVRSPSLSPFICFLSFWCPFYRNHAL